MSKGNGYIVRIIAGALLLFAVSLLGGYLGGVFFPKTLLVNGMETISTKIGCSVGIFIASLVVRRFVLHCFVGAVICMAITETFVLLIIICFTGLRPLTLANLHFISGWLYALTWNLVIAFLIGSAFGQMWDNWVTKAGVVGLAPD